MAGHGYSTLAIACACRHACSGSVNAVHHWVVEEAWGPVSGNPLSGDGVHAQFGRQLAPRSVVEGVECSQFVMLISVCVRAAVSAWILAARGDRLGESSVFLYGPRLPAALHMFRVGPFPLRAKSFCYGVCPHGQGLAFVLDRGTGGCPLRLGCSGIGWRGMRRSLAYFCPRALRICKRGSTSG